MPQLRIPAVFMRGGTSKAIMFLRRDLPQDPETWGDIFLSAIGAPDPNGRQLDGMGGGVSSLSKICIIGPSSRPDADVDYTFAQIGVDKPVVDFSGNCGNMSSAVGPFAIDEGLVKSPHDGEAVVRIHNTNTNKIIVSRFTVTDGEADVDGDMTLDGVSGSGAPIRLEFVDPGGAKTGRLLPTGRPVDGLDVPELGRVEASLIDAANPCVFVSARSLGMSGAEMPADLEQNEIVLHHLEAIRRAASVAMGLARDPEHAATIPSVPKVAMVSAPQEMTTLSGRRLTADQMNIGVRMISIGQPHRAVPLTGAMCLAVAARVPGSIPHELARRDGDTIRVAQPSGVTVVDAKVSTSPERATLQVTAEYAAVYRTARRLFEGHVLCRIPRARD
jgi:2-methylaconitate cis-trans-isomerase PrpF